MASFRWPTTNHAFYTSTIVTAKAAARKDGHAVLTANPDGPELEIHINRQDEKKPWILAEFRWKSGKNPSQRFATQITPRQLQKMEELGRVMEKLFQGLK
ncbi:MAG: hypothetical protein HY917_05085 [Candidatus Diapherotrites archaeon]|nr:hypothetical protein [Candidatus Diapherotrites archaeon]